MPDMLVNLYELEENFDFQKINKAGYKIVRLLSPNFHLLNDFIMENFTNSWASEIKAACYNNNPKCFIVVKDNKICGFAAYDATCKGFFGPLGVKEEHRGYGLASSLIMKCLYAMKEEGYAYAIIGGVGDAAPLYEKVCHAVSINSLKSVYSRMI